MDENESEEHLKNDVVQFLNDTWYKSSHKINTKDRTDLVIYNDHSTKSTAGVLIEVKKPANKSEMISKENLNTKALQELVLYYLLERTEHQNQDIKHIIVTNVYEWFIFDARVIHDNFYKNTALIRAFRHWETGQKDSDRPDMFYKDIAGPAIDEVQNDLEFTYLDLRDFAKNASKNGNISRLIPLYKILSPIHLLKQPFINDSNTLDRKFYNELLHIIGLEEVKEGSKKVIRRKEEPDPGSLLENTIKMLVVEDRLRHVSDPGSFGGDQHERLFNVSLQLCITWVDRILFLKLLEGQLLKYHDGDKDYRFLNFNTIPNFDELNKLFFQVLAQRSDERTDSIQQKYAKVPYLNSSLFEINRLEDEALRINSLDDGLTMPLHKGTVLRNASGKKRDGELPALQYLFEFLDAYDFSSEGTEEIQEDNKTLINASVLGLIFEKINGYKDGSFFTPGFITMYMCRETLRRAVIQKFNDHYKWDCKEFHELYNRIKDEKEANAIINSLKICDPAVGSGHFLVSALNEIMAIKSALGVLCDREGKVLRGYDVEVVNDELIMSVDHETLFQYTPGNKESQRVQEAVFHEKATIIENCLFGVDINPNSVKICRLRLWIELLKSAYYTKESTYSELETLPNIDINIKQGNSLISRFDLDSDISKTLKKSKWDIAMYQNAVSGYKNTTSKEDKRQFENLIERIKDDFETEISKKDRRVLRANKLKGELIKLTTQTSMFDMSAAEKKKWQKEVETKTRSLQKLETELEEIRDNKIYQEAFEWRFEFPEVLDDKGNFVGFDVVIGNPPYIRIQDLQQYEGVVRYYSENYQAGKKGNYDIYVLFIELGLKITYSAVTYILPHKFINASYGEGARKMIFDMQALRGLVHFGASQVFEDATTYTCLLFLHSNKQNIFLFNKVESLQDWKEDALAGNTSVPLEAISTNTWNLMPDHQFKLMQKLQKNSKSLEQVTTRIFQGIKTSADKIYIVKERNRIDRILEIECPHDGKIYEVESDLFHDLIKGGDSKRYYFRDSDLLVLFPYDSGKLITEFDMAKKYPGTYKYLQVHKEYLEKRENGSFKGTGWFQYGRHQAIDIISTPKLFTPDLAPYPSFMIDVSGEKYFTGGTAGGYGIIPTNIDKYFLLGLLNSSVVGWYISKASTQMRGGWYSFESRFIKDIPIKDVDSGISESISISVQHILDQKDDDATCDTSKYEKEIDKLVYELYGLTENEVRIVEEATK